MEDLYEDLENFNDVNLLNELRSENKELKQKLGQYADSMETLQKDFDNLSAEFKRLETNYSSLLKSARAEIKRKTDMIKNLNIEKDMLVLKQFKDRPEKRRKLLNPYKLKGEGKAKQKNDPNTADDVKQQDESKRKECDRQPSESSSTVTEKSSKSLSTENRVGDNTKPTVRNTNKDTETNKNDVFPNDRDNYHDERFQVGGVTDRRISTLASQQFLKFSSDEEFEDMYSALEPKTNSKGSSFGDEPQKGPKRIREEPQHARFSYDSAAPQDKRLNYTDAPRDRYNKNRSRKFYENDRNMNRDKHDLPPLHRNKYSPDRLRYGKREFGDDRFLQQYDRHRWLDSAPGDRYQYRSRERRPYPDRGRSNQNPDIDRNNYSDSYAGKHKLANSTQIHGDYDQPLTKRFRGDQYAYTDEDRRRNDRLIPHEYNPSEMKDAYQPFQINNDLVNAIYMDIDKPTSDLAKLTGAADDNNGNNDANQDTGLVKTNVDGNNDLQTTKTYNAKCNEGEKVHKTSKYKIPLKKDKPNFNELSETLKTKSNKVDISIGSSGTVGSLSHKGVPSANDCNKISEVVKIVECSKLKKNTVHENIPAKMSKIGKNKIEVNSSSPHEVERKLPSTKNIVEGDLELSDETNDDTQGHDKKNEDTKKKHKSKKKSRRDISKDKYSHLEENTRKTRSKTDKDKEVKPKSKFSELFGDSSSLITPEDLELASAQAPVQMAESYAAVCEDAQDGIHLQNKQKHILTLAAKKEISTPYPNKISPQTDSSLLEEINIAKNAEDNKSHTNHGNQRKSEVFLPRGDDNDLKDIKLSFAVNPSTRQTTESVKTILLSGVEKAVSSGKPKKQLDNSENKTKVNDLEIPLVPDVKTAAPYKKCKDTLKVTKPDKKTRGDGVESCLMPAVNTALSNEILYENKPNNITESDVMATQLPLEEKAKELTENCKEILNVTDLDKSTENDVVKTHFPPETKAMASSGKSKETCNISKPDEKTKREVGEVHLIPETKSDASSEMSKDLFNAPEADKETENDPNVQTHLTPEVKAVASSEKSKGICDLSKLDEKTKTKVGKGYLMPEIQATATSEKPREIFNAPKVDKKTNDPTVETSLMAEVKPSASCDKFKENIQTKSEKKPKGGALKCSEKNKEHTKSNRKTKSNEDKRSPSREVAKKSFINKSHVKAEPNEPLTTSSNKENESCEKISEGTVNHDMPKIFEDTHVPNNENISIDKNKTDEEKLTVNVIPKESVNNTRINDTPNLEAVTEDPGLVNTVVISSGIQPSNANALQINTTDSHYSSLKALATSTPAKELSSLNTLYEIEPNVNPLANCVNMKTANDNPVSKYDESDIPDVRIYCHRRRRKVIK